jgi:hypothetical protein
VIRRAGDEVWRGQWVCGAIAWRRREREDNEETTVIMKKTKGKSAKRGAVKLATNVPTSKARMAASTQAELTPDHAAFQQLLGQVADGLDSLQHHLNVFQHVVTTSGRENPSKASKERGRAVR